MFGRRAVRLEAALWERAKRRARELGYESLEEMVSHLLERELRAPEEEATKARVLEKMKGLGYLQ